MNKWLASVAALAVVSAGGYAQDLKSGEQKVAFEKRSFPFEGEVSVERLNVRLFPKADQTSIITSVLALGDKVTVVSEKDEYFQILPPKGSTVWVFGKNVKREGEKAVVTANDVPVRLDSRVNADILCVLKEGDPLKIAGEHMGWLKVEAPAVVKYFVGRKYIRAGKELDGAILPNVTKKPESKIDGDSEARAIMAVADLELDKQNSLISENKMDQVDFRRVVESYDLARGKAHSDPVRAEVDRGLKRYQQINAIWESAKAQIASKEEEVRKQFELLSQKPVEPKGPLMTGFVDTTGILFNRPGAHKLVMGGKIICFLRSKEGDDKMITQLNDHYQKYVGVNGILIKNPDGWEGYSVVVVDEIVPLQKE
jgi:uncharacterized protein YgiM (DUF1202 family)